MFTSSLGSGKFGVFTFFANENPPGLSGRTLNCSQGTDNSIEPAVLSPIYNGVQPSVRVLGNFQRFFQLSHVNLCRYIDAMVGRHEQVVLVQEYYESSLQDAIRMELFKDNFQACLRIGCQLEMALEYLHREGVIVGNMTAANIMVCSPGTWPPLVKLFNFGMFWATENGILVDFPIASPAYLAPEIIMTASNFKEDTSEINFYEELKNVNSNFSVYSDVWSLGVVLTELFTSSELASTVSNIHQLLSTLVNVAYQTSGDSVSACDLIFRTLKCKFNVEEVENFKEDIISFEKLLRSSLELVPSHRALPNQVLGSILAREVISECRNAAAKGSRILEKGLNPFRSRCQQISQRRESDEELTEEMIFELIPESSSVIDHLKLTRPLEEVYYLLSLVSPDPRVLVKKASFHAQNLPPICRLAPLFLSKVDRAFGAVSNRRSLYTRTVVEIPLEPLISRIEHSNVKIEDLYCLIEKYKELEEFEEEMRAKKLEFFKEVQKQPLVIRERDPEYQLHRCVLFHRLLESYPYTRLQLLEAARVDVVPLYRGLVWCCLLDVPADSYEYFINIDVDSLHPSHKQIDVDIPRCHQYDDLLASHMGRIKLKRILTAWLRKNPKNAYWQGLDSLLAPFLRLNFTNEPLALACFQRFIDKYLNNFFTRDNSDVVREYLAVFSHLIAFHDAELSAHLQNIGFVPDLYAISWFLTAFAHVFPLPKLYHLYDTLLLHENNFLLCVGLAVLHQLRSKLITFEFNECILLSSDMSDFDTAGLVADAIWFYESTPPSLMRHPLSEPTPKEHTKAQGSHFSHRISSEPKKKMEPVYPMDPCGRISVEDVQSFWSSKSSNKLVVIDIRNQEDFIRGAFPDSINIPAMNMEASLDGDAQLQRMIFDHNSYTGNMDSKPTLTTTFVIVCNPKASYKHASDFARKLSVDYLFSRVCILSGGTEALAESSLLVVPGF